MYKVFISLLLSIEGIACLAGLFKWSTVRHTLWKYFVIYLAFVFISEVFGLLCVYYQWKEINQFYFSFFVIPLEFIFFFCLYGVHSVSTKGKYVTIFSVILYLISLALENSLANEFNFFSMSYTVGNLLLLIVIFRYLYFYLKSDDLLLIRGNPLIYISIGLLVFYIGSFPFYGLKNYLWTHYKIIGTNYWYFATILNCIMYCMFTASFIWGKFKSISSSS